MSIRISEAEAAALDAQRGTVSRANYLRSLITSKRATRQVVEQVEVRPTIPTPVTAEPSVISGKPDPSPVVEVAKKHFHRYEPDPEPFKRSGGMDVYLLRCECGLTREERRPIKIPK